MQPFSIDEENDNEKLTALAVILPLAVVGFVIAAGCWTIFAAAGEHLRSALALGSMEFGLLLAMPMAAGGLFALPAGIAARKIGARRVMITCLLGLAASMALLLVVETRAGYLLVATGLGLAGGFYSAGLQFVACHAPARHMGLVLGIFGSGVTGAGLNYYLVPLMLRAFSWDGVPLAYLVVLLLVAVLLVILTDDSYSRGGTNTEHRLGGLPRNGGNNGLWPLCAYFGVIAGSFFSLALWLPDFMSSRFLLTTEYGAHLALWFVIPGALAQIAGGGLADRYGEGRVVVRSLGAGLVALFILSYPPMTLSVRGVDSMISFRLSLPLVFEGFFIVLLGVALGVAMGGVQRKVVAQSGEATALAGGLLLLGACVVAFLLPVLIGTLIHWTGVGTAMFMIIFLLLAGSLWMFGRYYRREERQALLHKGVSDLYHLGGRGGL